MFMQMEKSSNNNNGTETDEFQAQILYDLDLISRFCLPICCRDTESREIALEVIGKTVQGWLDGIGSPIHLNIPQTNKNTPKNQNSNNYPPSEVFGNDRQSSANHNNSISNGSSAFGNDRQSSGQDRVSSALGNGRQTSGDRLSNGSNGFGSGRECSGVRSAFGNDEASGVSDLPSEYVDLVTLHMPILLRLSLNCPFTNVREKCQHILEIVKNRGLPIPYPVNRGPSAYIDPEELPPSGTYNEKTHALFVDAFVAGGSRLDHVTQVMGYHPAYLEHFLRAQGFILRGDGPLPYDYRHFIAIMAAGRHQCGYLISLQKQEFLAQGGDPAWLKGLAAIPPKLRNLYDINKILAHRPWLINKHHIEKLTKGKDSWSLAEVVHAIVILAHFHSLSSFVFSCGVNQEVDQSGGHAYQESASLTADIVVGGVSEYTPIGNGGSLPKDIPDTRQNTPPSPITSSPSPTEPEVGITTLMQRMKTLSEKTEQCTQVELTKRFEHVESQSAELNIAGGPEPELSAEIGQFVEDPTFLYQDFARRGDADIPTFRIHDYSWDDHGYSLVNRLYNDVGNLLDDKFKTAYNLTYYTMGGRTDVDTSRFRRAIWNYIQCMFGIRHDDYDYGEVNQLLERSLKTFIKSACCYPERVTKKDYDRVLREFKHSEKVHVNLMILEARMQAELLYALRAVMRYMT